MPKFKVGQWVKRDGIKGVVRGYRKHEILVRWLGRDRAKQCDPRELIRSRPPRALVLEGSLDDHLHSTRSEEEVLRTWLKASGVDLAYKNIHTLADIGVIGRAVGNNKPAFVHISCHGGFRNNRAFIVLAPKYATDDYIYLNDERTIDVFKLHFGGLPVLFSACDLGKYQYEMEKFRSSSELSNVAAFTREIFDSEALLFEMLLYHGILVNSWKFETAVNNANQAMQEIWVRGSRGRGQKFVRVF